MSNIIADPVQSQILPPTIILPQNLLTFYNNFDPPFAKSHQGVANHEAILMTLSVFWDHQLDELARTVSYKSNLNLDLYTFFDRKSK